MKISNDGQFSNLYKGQIPFPYSADKKPVGGMNGTTKRPQPDYTVVSKPLTSVSWVTVKKRSKGQQPTDSTAANYRVKKVGNIWVDIDKPRMSETERAQWELYRRLKKDYEMRQKIKERNDSIARSNKIQTTHQLVDGVMVNIKKIPNFDGSLFRKAV